VQRGEKEERRGNGGEGRRVEGVKETPMFIFKFSLE